MLDSFRSEKAKPMKSSKKKEITDSFCEEDTQENVKGTRGAGESLSNYSVPFVNLSGLFGK